MDNETAQATRVQAAEELKRAAQDIKSKARVAGAAAWDVTKATYEQVQNRAADYSRATDRAIRSQPYVALGFAFCIGMLIGAVVTRPKVVEQED